MVKRFLAACAGVSLGLSLLCAAEEAKPPSKGEAKTEVKIGVAAVARFVAQLGSDRFDDREQASKELDALGRDALDALRPALASRDEETRRRAGDLLQRIEKRLESSQLTQPKLVRLVYTDTPVQQAVQDIARKTGFTIQIDGDQTKLNGRKITLDTGEVPFWQAVDQFCLKAGLVERGSQAIADNVNPEMDQMRMRMRMGMWMGGQQGGAGPRPEMPLVLLDGNPQAAPTYYGGALRVRVLPRATAAPGAVNNNGTPVNRANEETLLTVEVTPEPKMGWQNVLSVRIERMLDEKGAEMKVPLPYIRDIDEFDEEELGMRAYSGRIGPSQTHLSKQVPLRVAGLKDIRKIKEIHGAVAAEILTPMQPLLTIDDILNAAGKTELANGGGSLKVVEAKRDEKGQVCLKVVVEKHVPGGAEMAAWRMRMFGPGVQPNQQNDKNTVGRMLVLKDDKGEAIPLGNVSAKPVDDFGMTMEYDLTYQANDKTIPAKLVYVGQRITTIDVPFVIKDVPAP